MALHELYPEAPVFTAFVDFAALGSHADRFANWDLRTTWLSRVPLITKLYSPLRLLAPWAFRSLDLSIFDVVISSSNAYHAKSVRVPNGKHICYCHTPPRSLWGYTTQTNWQKRWWTRVPGELINHFLRVVDVVAAQEVDVFLANSTETQRRITKFYRRDSQVVYPPVGLERQVEVENEKGKGEKQQQTATPHSSHPTPQSSPPYFLYVNRLAWAKHPELAVQACSKLQIPLKVVGTGALLPALQAKAGPSIEFLGTVPDEQLVELYRGAEALLYPVEDEDFGIVPVEAMQQGCPVIAHYSGGPRETVVGVENQVKGQGEKGKGEKQQQTVNSNQLKVDSSQEKGVGSSSYRVAQETSTTHQAPASSHSPHPTLKSSPTGLFFTDLSVVGLQSALKDFQRHRFDRAAIGRYAQSQFGHHRFAAKIDNIVMTSFQQK